MSVTQLHQRLTPDHFVAHAVPELRRLRDLLAGESLEWDLVEAVADVCFPHDPADCSGERLEMARALWDRAQSSPTPPEGTQELALARELLAAKDRTIEVYQELQRVRQAYEASERGRHQALQIATLLFAMLGQTQAKVAELKRRVDALETMPANGSDAHRAVEVRLSRAQQQQAELSSQLSRAERERDTAQQVADHAARRIQELEDELARLRVRMGHGDSEEPHDPVPQALQPDLTAISQDDVALDDVDRALEKVRAVLDEEHEVVQQAADEVGYRTRSTETSAVTVVPGQVQRVPGPPPSDGLGGVAQLSGTTLDNPVTGSRAPVLASEAAPVLLSADHLRYIGAATRRIARGIDLDEIVMGLCRATVPMFSDAILVYLREPLPVGDERPVGPLVLRLRRTDRIPAERDTEPAVQPEPSDLAAVTAELCEVRPGGALAEVLRGVRPVFADAPAAYAALPELIGENSLFTVPTGQRTILAPLRGRRRVIGAALFLRRPERMAFEQDDLLVAAQLATHSALGIDKAVLYGREAYIADELQRRMLPERLPHSWGVQLAHRYLPAAETARVGGDWYDVIALPGSRVALVVGDVVSHSMTSAAVMGQLRASLKTLASQDLPPQEILHQIDDVARDLGNDHMATCMCAVYDPVSHRITIANAGHPPPVLLHPDGRAEVLRVPPGAPIGVGGVHFEADLAEAGIVAVHQPEAAEAGSAPAVSLLERVLSGLRKL
ncbi:SpoIIE family protein phosphatase [Streptomyces sp. K1PN6]|uniref:SpoIIE family protein phosphatase n=1 Tax=Streptomyces acidicola TaxID=2596892 RepID=A0A5N8X536_9ACTN|nr:SpoIIE family protein phosphatase [Streptomyces acidicola]